ncbi:MAG: SIMPL domain-containing protein [Candidatus Pacebacteria bacterium]|nr:SIMPL domain-containing protein [Candidatus Paceibacterota bacterium]MDR3583368.1 SIMPL domain-containing protein [Candidatus Paceibacterota bacterium]
MEETNGEFNSQRRKQAFVLTLVGMILVAVVLVMALFPGRGENQNKDRIMVMGEGKVSYQPDTATINLGMQINNTPTSDEAMNQLNTKIADIIAAVGKLGVQKDAITTSNYNVSPGYNYKDGSSTISGYNANETLAIKVEGADKNPDLVGKITAVAGTVGSNQVQGIDYSVSSLANLQQEARIKAIEDARTKAQALAQAAGIKKLGPVVSWQDASNAPQPVPMYSDALAMPAGAGKSVAPAQVPSGTQEVTVDVNVNFAEN